MSVNSFLKNDYSTSTSILTSTSTSTYPIPVEEYQRNKITEMINQY